jgi:hypothetical protein
MVIFNPKKNKAMNLVYENRKSPDQINPSDGFLKRWLMSNSKQTIAKYAELERSEFKKPINISSTFLEFKKLKTWSDFFFT